MCGRFTNKLTWTEVVALYRLTMDRPPHNMRADYNVCPTDPVHTIVEHEGQRDLVQIRWGLVPYWWSKPLKKLRAATFNDASGSFLYSFFLVEHCAARRLQSLAGQRRYFSVPAAFLCLLRIR
jgi:hypothetical protein